MKLYYKDAGQGEIVVFLHGFPLDHQMWENQVEALQANYRVITPDLRGMGQSEPASDVTSMEQLAGDVLSLLDELKVEKAILAGFSMGGYVAFSLLRQAPNRFKALVLANTRADADAVQGQINRMKMSASILEKGADAAKEAMLPKMFTEQTAHERPELVQKLSNWMSAMKPIGLVHACISMAFRQNSVPMLPSIQIPTLVIAGQQDQITPPELMKGMASEIPNSQFVEIEGASHLCPVEQPEAFNQALLAFLEQVK